jgi:hypothetical protein
MRWQEIARRPLRHAGEIVKPREERLSLYESLTATKNPERAFDVKDGLEVTHGDHFIAAAASDEAARELMLALNLCLHDWRKRFPGA